MSLLIAHTATHRARLDRAASIVLLDECWRYWSRRFWPLLSCNSSALPQAQCQRLGISQTRRISSERRTSRTNTVRASSRTRRQRSSASNRRYAWLREHVHLTRRLSTDQVVCPPEEGPQCGISDCHREKAESTHAIRVVPSPSITGSQQPMPVSGPIAVVACQTCRSSADCSL